MKRIRLIEATSPYANTKWLIQLIRRLLVTLKRYEKEFQSMAIEVGVQEREVTQQKVQNKRMKREYSKLQKKSK